MKQGQSKERTKGEMKGWEGTWRARHSTERLGWIQLWGKKGQDTLSVTGKWTQRYTSRDWNSQQ